MWHYFNRLPHLDRATLQTREAASDGEMIPPEGALPPDPVDDRHFRSIRSDPRFRSVLKTIGMDAS
jgi:hypothetical protein